MEMGDGLEENGVKLQEHKMNAPNPSEAPLAERIRPTLPDHIFGQDHIWGPNTPLRKLATSDSATAILFWGPPGTGKTTLAQMVGRQSQRRLVTMSAVSASVKEMRAVIDDSLSAQSRGEKSYILFIDEIHRLAKNQQDVLLPGIEQGHIRFIGATTENPSFTVNNAILSRCLTFNLKPLTKPALVQMMLRALASSDPALADLIVDQPELELIADAAQGDGRQCLNILSAMAACIDRSHDQKKYLNREILIQFGTSLPIRFDRDGEEHYDLASAMIKSIRASHPDAAIYYMARMIEGGEDPLFIARRLLISASEDIGNANPTALLIADSAFRATQVIGLPEARIALAQCVTYLASSPKSNRAYLSINQALAEVTSSGPLPVPMHLRNAPTDFMKRNGYGQNYVYAHNDLAKARQQPYLPPQLKGKKFYEPIPVGTEKTMIETLKQLKPLED